MPTSPAEELIPLTKSWWEKVKDDYTADEDCRLCIASKQFERAWKTPEHKATIKNLAEEFLSQAEMHYKSARIGNVLLFLFECYSLIYERLNKRLRMDFLDYCINNYQTTQSCLPPTNS